MNDDPLTRIQPLVDWVQAHAWELASGPAVLVGLAVIWRVLRRVLRRARAVPRDQLPPPIDWEAFGSAGPTAGMRPLELYHIPVHLVAVVVAPVGRAEDETDLEGSRRWLDGIVPGLAGISESHATRIVRWPRELSARGFSQRLFVCLRLPGRHGKGSPWSAVAGRFEVGDRTYVAGLVLRASADNNLGEFVVERPNGWLDMLRARSPA